jgi:hypothetical protein
MTDLLQFIIEDPGRAVLTVWFWGTLTCPIWLGWYWALRGE